jgi:hypothetical protein
VTNWREGVTQSRCVCGYTLDSAATLEGEFRPKPGDLAVCMACRRLLQFDDTGLALPLDDEEAYLRTLDDETRRDVQEIRRRIGVFSKLDPDWPKGTHS